MVIGFLEIRSNKEMHKILKEMKLGERNICHSFPICLISYYIYIYFHIKANSNLYRYCVLRFQIGISNTNLKRHFLLFSIDVNFYENCVWYKISLVNHFVFVLLQDLS